jgi:hypothetical protein
MFYRIQAIACMKIHLSLYAALLSTNYEVNLRANVIRNKKYETRS